MRADLIGASVVLRGKRRQDERIAEPARVRSGTAEIATSAESPCEVPIRREIQ